MWVKLRGQTGFEVRPEGQLLLISMKFPLPYLRAEFGLYSFVASYLNLALPSTGWL